MSFNIRKACQEDLPAIRELLAHDVLGQRCEALQDPLPASYYQAFAEIDADKNNYLIVVEDNGVIIGTLQLTILTHLTYQGGKRGQIEGVRITNAYRGQGIGSLMLQWAIDKAKELDCYLLQLTSDKRRTKAIEFYQKLGFTASHEGLKLHLKSS